MIKTDIKMEVTPEQSKKIQEICFANGIIWWGTLSKQRELHDHVLVINKLSYKKAILADQSSINYGKEEIVDADFFIETNGICNETSVVTREEVRDYILKEERILKEKIEALVQEFTENTDAKIDVTVFPVSKPEVTKVFKKYANQG